MKRRGNEEEGRRREKKGNKKGGGERRERTRGGGERTGEGEEENKVMKGNMEGGRTWKEGEKIFCDPLFLRKIHKSNVILYISITFYSRHSSTVLIRIRLCPKYFSFFS